MRRIAKLKPREVSMTVEGANRRVIAAYKSAVKPADIPTEFPGESVHKSSVPQGTTMDIQSAISNTDPDIMSRLVDLAKSADSAKGKGYTPQAASIIKAVGRLLAPFAGELTLSDLQAVGKAAGLGANTGTEGADSETAPAFKSKVKTALKDEEDTVEADDSDSGSEDEGKAMTPGKGMDFDADDAGDDPDEDEGEETEDEDENDEEEDDDGKAIKKSASAPNIALKAKKDDTPNKPFPGAAKPFGKKGGGDKDDEDDKKKVNDDKTTGQPTGSKAKEKNVAKSAQIGSNADDSRYEEILKSHRAQLEINEALQAEVAKTRKDLDDERNFRAIESIKKSARADLSHLNVDVDKLAPILKSLKEADDQGPFEQLSEILKSADKQVEAAQKAGGIFEAVGKSSSNAPAGGASWESRIEARVDELHAQDRTKHRAVVYDEFAQSSEGREMIKNHRAERTI